MTDNPNDPKVTVTLPKSWLVQKHLTTLADAIAAGITTVPDSVDVWKHGLTAADLLDVAHDLRLKIRICDRQASVNVPVGTVADHGIDITYTMITTEMDPAAVNAYNHHNEVCLKRPADQVIRDIFESAFSKAAGMPAGIHIIRTTDGS